VPLSWPDTFETRVFATGGAHIHARFSKGLDQQPRALPALLLLHGFPQSHSMWHAVAQHLAAHFLLVVPDLRGYGDSSKAAGLPDHSNYSKRAMAADMVALMDALGVDRFHLCGHDRGARVAHRLALDHPQRVGKLCLVDIVPTLDVFEGNGLRVSYMDLARDFYHWFHMQQPSPIAETMMGALDADTARAYLHVRLNGGAHVGLAHLTPQVIAEYERCFCTAEGIHAACEDYRAAATIDLEHDRHSRATGQKLACDTLVLWGARGLVPRLFDPLSLWVAQCSGRVEGHAIDAGHFIPEERPETLAAALQTFCR
jgi:haloacetate dehalogenase